MTPSDASGPTTDQPAAPVAGGAPLARASATPTRRAVTGHDAETVLREARLEHGGQLEELRVGYRLYGDLAHPVVVVVGGISASRRVTRLDGEADAGWWEHMVGPGRPIDTERYAVLGVDWVGGSGATSGPGVGPGAALFPTVSTYDQATAIVAALDASGVERAHAAVGASYGAMVVLALAARHARRLGRIVAIAGAHESHPMATALRALQRRMVRFGLETGRARDGLVLARALGMTTYRTASEFAARFDQTPRWTDDGPRFEIEEYLTHVGERFAAWAAPQSFLRLSESLDLHQVAPGDVTTPATLIAVDSDTLVPEQQMRGLAEDLAGPATLHVMSSIYGHDAFLTEIDRMGALITAALVDLPA